MKIDEKQAKKLLDQILEQKDELFEVGNRVWDDFEYQWNKLPVEYQVNFVKKFFNEAKAEEPDFFEKNEREKLIRYFTKMFKLHLRWFGDWGQK